MSVAYDTNILVYATAPASEDKGLTARRLLADGMRSGVGALMLQSLSEFSHVMIRKMAMPSDRVASLVEAWRAVLPVHPAVAEDVASALWAVSRHGLAFWDAMLWAGARRTGARHLLTEDFQDGRVLEGVSFINPFAPANAVAIEALFQA